MTKKKLIITITSLCLVVVAAVAAVIGIIAATNVGINSNLSVSYTPGANVLATAKGKYAVAGGSEVNFSTRTYHYGDVDVTGDTVQPDTDKQNIPLTDNATYVVIEFSFKNDAKEANTNSKKLTVVLTDNSTQAEGNVNYELKTTKTQITKMDKDGFNAIESAEGALTNIGIDQTGYVYVLVEIKVGEKGSWGAKAAGSTYSFGLTAAA